MDALFGETMQALQGMRDAVRQELATLSEGRVVDKEPPCAPLGGGRRGWGWKRTPCSR